MVKWAGKWNGTDNVFKKSGQMLPKQEFGLKKLPLGHLFRQVLLYKKSRSLLLSPGTNSGTKYKGSSNSETKESHELTNLRTLFFTKANKAALS